MAISGIRLRYMKIKEDFTWWNVEPALWSMAEISMAIICLCAPTLKALAARLGLLVTRTGTNCTSRNQNSHISHGPSSTVPLSPGAKTTDTSQTNFTSEKPDSVGNFVVEQDQYPTEQERLTVPHIV